MIDAVVHFYKIADQTPQQHSEDNIAMGADVHLDAVCTE
jgi:hypothetical protein